MIIIGWKMKNSIINGLNEMFPNPVCELNYRKDYELLIATILSAQSTDKRVNQVTEILFNKYDLKSLSKAEIKDIEMIIRPVGTYRRKSFYIKEVASSLLKNYEGVVPNNRNFIESLPGVGRKTCNVVLANLYNEPTMAVDTHVTRCSKLLGLASIDDDVNKIEAKLTKFFPKKDWNRVNDQLVLFGRYICKSKKPLCDICQLKKHCVKFK